MKNIDNAVPMLRMAWKEFKPWYENLFLGREVVLGSVQRTPVEQLINFCQGRLPIEHVRILAGKRVEDKIITWKDGFIMKSKHNSMPLSEAIDIWIKINGEYTWDEKMFYPIGKFIQEKYKHILRWGGNFKDYCHIEMIK